MGVLRWLQRHSRRAQTVHNTTPRWKPWLERLEDRWLPSQTTIFDVSPEPSIYGDGVTFSARVNATAPEQPVAPAGLVRFFEKVGGVPVELGASGPLQPNAGGFSTVTFTTGANQLTGGTHFIFGSFESSDGQHAPSQSPDVTHQVNRRASSTTIVSAVPSPSKFGTNVVFTITVEPQIGGVGSSGVVQVFDGGVLLGDSTALAPDVNGVPTATFTTNGTQLSVGSHDITADYGGDQNFGPSTSPIFVQQVNSASTTTTLSTAPNPSNFGDMVTLTAFVDGNIGGVEPSGTVTFFDGATPLQTVALTPGGLDTSSATYVTGATELSGGDHQITAVYNGDPSFGGSTSAIVTQVVNPAPVTTTITTVTPSPSRFGDPVAFTIEVAPDVGGVLPTGQVSLMEGGTVLGTGNLANVGGVATVTITTGATQLSVSSHSIQAVYAGDTNYAAGASSAAVHIVGRAATTTTITNSAPNPSTFGQAVTFNITVAPTLGGILPTGQVSILNNGSPIGTANLVDDQGVARAVFTTNPADLGPGTHTITASYGGDGNFDVSTSADHEQVVNKAVSTTTIVTATPNPSTFGNAVTFDITVTPTLGGVLPSGQVTIFDGGTQIGTANLTNDRGLARATFTTGAVDLTGGSHIITAVYAGDSNYGTSTSAGFNQTVNRAATTTNITDVNPSPSDFGQTVTFTFQVTPGVGGVIPTGTVTFRLGATVLGNSTNLANIGGNATATFTTQPTQLPAGVHTISATYTGDVNFDVSNTSVNQTVNQAATGVTIVSVTPSPSSFGDRVTLVFTVTPAQGGVLPTGNVIVMDGDTQIGVTAPLASNNGVASATFTTGATQLATGAHQFQGVYNGDNNYRASASEQQRHIVNLAPTTVALAASSAAPNVGQQVTFTATVRPQTPGAGVPAGTVTFFVDGVSQTNVSLDGNGRATFNAIFTDTASHVVRADYGGNNNFSLSSQATTVRAAQSTIATLINQVYRDLLGRAPTQAEVSRWTVFLRRSTATEFAKRILDTREYEVRRFNVLIDTFIPCHHDPLEEEGPMMRVNLTFAGKPIEELSAEVIGSMHYFKERGWGTRRGFITSMFQDVLHRAPRQAELNRFLGLLRTQTRTQIARILLTSPEYYRTLVRDLYQQFLHRAPTPGELRLNVAKLQRGASQDSIIAALIGRRDYLTRP